MNKEIEKYYNKIAKEYTKQHGYSEQLSIQSLKKFIKLLPLNSNILDVGCGGGQDSKFLHDNGFNVLGIDFSKEMIRLSRKYSPKTNFKVLNVMNLSFTNKYDGIWCSRVFHNVSIEEQDRFIKKLKVLLKKGGILYLTSVISDKKEDYDIFDFNNKIIKKYLSSKSFKNLLIKHNFKILNFKYWKGRKGMEIFAQK
jgi:2-polyprenyl-3-methyl-5-hydroxy-6-metoxy-1,4-benzoquinol methylase